MISNHKPDFQTLVVEGQNICSGPEDEETYLDELKNFVISSSCLIEDETRQGIILGSRFKAMQKCVQK